MKSDEKWIKIQSESDYNKWLSKVYWNKYWVSIHMNSIYQDNKKKDCMKWEVTIHDRPNNNREIITIPFELYKDAKEFFTNVKPYLLKIKALDDNIQKIKDKKTTYCKKIKKTIKTAKVKSRMGWIGEDWTLS